MGVASKAARTAFGGEDDRYLGEEGAPRMVEVVVVLVVRERGRVDAAEVGRR
jgi:hypothetical protein